MCSMLKDFIEMIKDKEIENIYLAGFIDIEEGIVQFYPDLRYLYFEFESAFIEFESIEQFSKLKINIVELVMHKFEIDEDMTKGITNISEIILNDNMSAGNKITRVNIFNLDKAEDIFTCDALEIELENGQKIFLDPSYYFGINIGGEKQKEIWNSNLNEDSKLDIMKIDILDKYI